MIDLILALFAFSSFFGVMTFIAIPFLSFCAIFNGKYTADDIRHEVGPIFEICSFITIGFLVIVNIICNYYFIN